MFLYLAMIDSDADKSKFEILYRGIRHCVCMPICRKNACFYIMLRKRCTANTKI